MSLSITGVSLNDHDFGADFAVSSAPPIPTPTLAQQLAQLSNSGLSNDQIATALGLTLSQVLTSLHETSAVTAQSAAAVVSLSSGLSVKA